MVLFQKNTFQRLKSFFWLVGRSCNASIRSRGEKTFSACENLWKKNAYFFGHSIWLRVARELCTGVPWLCECWCSHTWECFKSPATPLGMFPVDTPMTIPWPSQVWLHHHSQSHGALSHPNPQPNAVGPQQYVWMCEKKLFAGWKVFSPPDLKGALPLRPDNQKKLFSFWKVFSDHSPLKR